MRRWILAAVLLIAPHAVLAQAAEAAAAAPEPAAAVIPSPVMAPPESKPEPAAKAPAQPAAAVIAPASAKPAAAIGAPAQAKPAAVIARPAGASSAGLDVRPAAAIARPAATSSTGLDVLPASAKTKKQPPAAPTAPLAASNEVPSEAEQTETLKGVIDGMIESNKDLMNLPPEGAPPTSKDIVEAAARSLFFAMMNGDARTLTLASVTPFALEDRRIGSEDELFQEWLRHLRTKRTDLLVLYGVEVLTPDEMEKKYGKPPARLASLPWKTAKTYLAIGNLSGHAAIALFRETRPGEFYLVGYTD